MASKITKKIISDTQLIAVSGLAAAAIFSSLVKDAIRGKK